MLKRLSIKNVALIERQDIDFDDGFNVLTGETGAGKSIIIDAVNLALGERANRELIKSGAQKAVVEAEFDISGNNAIKDILRENELDEDDELIVSRELSVSGKNVCRINGSLISLGVLKQITDMLVDVHGQHEHQSLLQQNSHMSFLDSFAHDEINGLIQDVGMLYKRYKAINKELLGGFSSEDERRREADILQYQINEIERAELSEKEYQALAEEKKLLVNAERIMTALEQAWESLGGDRGAIEPAGAAVSAMKDIAGLSEEYGDAAKRLEDVYYSLEDVGYTVRDLRNSFDFDPSRIDEIETRLELYSNLTKKYGPSIFDVLEFKKNAEKRLYDIENIEKLRERLTADLAEVTEKYTAAAAALTEARKRGAEKLRAALLAQLKDLGMEKARFSADIQQQQQFGPKGWDRVEFMLSANPGEELKPLEKVASGGEMSRIMLAFKAIAADADAIPTLIFDEIDTGISGRIASVVGEKMVNISDSHQVLCVTHLPQIAALADAHFLVEKTDDGETTHTNMRRLSLEERYGYVARMMGGGESGAAYDHAKELISASESAKSARRG